jgi:hypothetical protein
MTVATSVGQDANSGKWNRYDWILIAVFCFAAMMLFSNGRNAEFQGDDDYLSALSFSTVSDALITFKTGNPREFVSSVTHLVGSVLCAPRHAPLLNLVAALFYTAYWILGIPISSNMLHAPVVFMSILTVALFYLILRRTYPTDRFLTVMGTLLLLISPLFVMVSRGLATYFLIPFPALLALLSVDSLCRDETVKWWIGPTLGLVVISDLIWFFTLPLLGFSLMLTSRNRKTTIIRLLSPQVCIPVLAIIVLYVWGSWLAYQHGQSTPLSILLTGHVSKIFYGPPVLASPAYLAECLSVLMGTGLPLILLLAIWVWYAAGRPAPSTPLTGFGLCGILGYGAVFYGLTPERMFVKYCYQMYLLLPFVALVIAMFSVLRSRLHCGLTWVSVLLIPLLILEILACVNFVWKIPISPMSGIYTQWAHGTFAPNHGTKAAGYLVRQWLETVWRQNPNQPVTVYASHYNTSFAVFSGLNASEKGWGFKREFGPNRPIKVLFTPAPQLPTSENFIYLLDLTATLPRDTNVTKLTQNQSGLLRYEIRSSSPRNGIAIVYVRPPEGIIPPPIPPGTVSMEQLESHYDQEYYRYSDFFPHSLAR